MTRLVVWAEQECGRPPGWCNECTPQTEPSADMANADHLTKVEREILDYVLEIAVVHLDNTRLEYTLSVRDVADCLSKTTGQIASALWRLMQSEYLLAEKTVHQKDEIHDETRLFPGSKALKTEPAFEELSEEELEGELAGLRGTPD